MNIIPNPNKKMITKLPCFYRYFEEIYPQKILYRYVEVKKYDTKSYQCSRFYKNISIFSI